MWINKYILFTITLLMFFFRALPQDREPKKMYGKEREKYLIDTGKELTKIYGPEYYREYGKPIISKIKKFKTDDHRIEISKNTGRKYYEVTFPYDREKERLEWDYASKIGIWKDSGEPFVILFGNGAGLNFFFQSHQARMQTGIERIPYEQAPERQSIWRLGVQEHPGQKTDIDPRLPISSIDTYAISHMSYPRSLLRKGIEGIVYCQATISDKGKLSKLFILQSPHPKLTKEAKRIIAGMPLWIPAMSNGRAIECEYAFSLPFVLKDYKTHIKQHESGTIPNSHLK